jgi:NAD(P)-dependent dehydrogenase (short-subunit alcohol dehydrogenase family)
VTAHYADVSDPASVDACIAEIVAAHGKIDNLVTSAGFTENFEAINYPIDRMRKLWGVNVDGTYLFATAVARHLVRSSSFFSPNGMALPPPPSRAGDGGGGRDSDPETGKGWPSHSAPGTRHFFLIPAFG